MRFIGKIIFHIFSNAMALLIAAQFVPGFSVDTGIPSLFIAAAILTAINMLIRPVVKLILGPLIFLTLGLIIIAINALSLYILDTLSASITIQGYIPLLLGTLIVGAVNILVSATAKAAYKD